jgi:hypothetical protein
MNTANVSDVESASDGCVGIDAHLHENAAKVVGEERQQLQGNADEQGWLGDVQPVAQPVGRNRPHSGVQPQLFAVVAFFFIPCNIYRKFIHLKLPDIHFLSRMLLLQYGKRPALASSLLTTIQFAAK